ncbi:hypothetical protein N9D84_04210, partial [Planktomarina temperata]|nr:hypothetical protein [Planktomarina temperata]
IRYGDDFIFGIPKTGSTSLRAVLGQYNYHYESGELLSNTYAVIRNPFDRFISGFLEVESRLRRPGHATERFYSSLNECSSIDEKFVRFFELSREKLLDLHVVPQECFLISSTSTRQVENVRLVCFDYMVDHFRLLDASFYEELVNLPHRLPKSKFVVDRLRTQLISNHEMKTFIQESYERDFTLYHSSVEDYVRKGGQIQQRLGLGIFKENVLKMRDLNHKYWRALRGWKKKLENIK